MPSSSTLPSSASFDAALEIRAQVRFLPVLVEFSRLFFGASLPNQENRQLLYALQLCVSEACTNVITHAYPQHTHAFLRLELRVDEEGIVIRLCDQGLPFDPATVLEPDLDHPAGHGLGVFFLRQLMDSLEYRRQGDTNILTLTKRF